MPSEALSPFISEPLMYLCNQSLRAFFQWNWNLQSDSPVQIRWFFCIQWLSTRVFIMRYIKGFEIVMYHRLLEFLKTYKILSNSQFGLRKLHSTNMASMTLMDQLITSLENDEHVIDISLDFSKALDTVDHVILSHYGVWLKMVWKLS